MAPGTRVFADTSEERKLALAYAATLFKARFDEAEQTDPVVSEMIAAAGAMHRFLVGPAALFLTIGEIRKQGTLEPTGRTPGGSTMQLRDNEEVPLSVLVASAKGNEVADQPGAEDDLSWTVEGGDGVIEIETSEDTRECVVRAVDLGSGVVRVALPGDAAFATLAVDVIAGEAAAVTINAGTPRKQQAGGGETEPPAEG